MKKGEQTFKLNIFQTRSLVSKKRLVLSINQIIGGSQCYYYYCHLITMNSIGSAESAMTRKWIKVIIIIYTVWNSICHQNDEYKIFQLFDVLFTRFHSMRTKFLMALCRLYFLNFHWMPLQSTNYYRKFQGSISGDNTIPFTLPTQWSNVDKWIAFVCHMMFFYYLLLIQKSKKKFQKN